MTLELAGRKIETVKIVDDDPYVREALAWTLEDTHLTPVKADTPLPELVEFITRSMKEVDAIICDHKLTKGKYASFNGAVAVANFYTQGFPALLCTAYGKAEMVNIRLYRHNIPALIEAASVTPESILNGLELCINEFRGKFTVARKSWKTQVRVEEVIRDSVPKAFDVVLRGWNSKEIIRLPLDLLPAEHRARIEPGFRFHAFVNKGANSQEELFFRDFVFD
jgi:hypothetical protein